MPGVTGGQETAPSTLQRYDLHCQFTEHCFQLAITIFDMHHTQHSPLAQESPMSMHTVHVTHWWSE